MSGKGSGRRPADVDDATLAANWAAIFGAKSADSSIKDDDDDNGATADLPDAG